MKNITASLIGMFQICPRETWLHANGIQMEHTSDTVAEGKLIHETSYADRAMRFQEVSFDGVKIDFFDAKNKVVHETKKSASMEEGHIAQVKYYLYVLHRNGIEGASGLIEYPRLRQTHPVSFDPETDIPMVETWIAGVRNLISQETCPPKLTKKTFCKSCSYYDFCWISELDE